MRSITTKYVQYRGPTGVGRVPNKRWTPAEKEVLQRLGDAGCTWDRVLEALPGRTICAINHYYASLVRKATSRI